MTQAPPSLTPQDCLVALMITVSVSDATIRTEELLAIEQVVNQLPVFAGYDPDRIKTVSQTVFDLMEEEDGLDALFGLVAAALAAMIARPRVARRLNRSSRGCAVDTKDAPALPVLTARFRAPCRLSARRDRRRWLRPIMRAPSQSLIP